MLALIQTLPSKAAVVILLSFGLSGIPEESSLEPAEAPSIGCRVETQSRVTITDDLYSLEISLEQGEGEIYYLVTTIDFKKESYTASPLSNNDFKGLFNVELSSNPNIALDDAIEETPQSIETMDPYGNVPVNWVREKTTYRRQMKVLSQFDFDAGGKVSFTIEPRCTFEEFSLTIRKRNGVLTIESSEC